jgi:DNA-binding transcriptional LysR family regulator
MRNITFKQLRTFLMVAQEKSFTRAATRLNLSQSALTLQIRELESEVGLKLFDRSTRSVDLTAPAAAFRPIAARLLDELTRALDDLRSVAVRERGSVVVVAGASVIALIIAPAVALLAERYPGIAVRLIEEVGEDVTRRVADGEADFGLGTFVRPSPTIETSLLMKDRIGILCTSDHALAQKKGPLTWSDLSRHPFATLSRGTAIRGMLDKDPDIGGMLPPPIYEASSISALTSLVQQGAGIALLPSLAAYPSIGGKLVFRTIQNPIMLRELSFIAQRRRSLTPAARQLAFGILDQLAAIRKRPNLDVVTSAQSLLEFRRRLQASDAAFRAEAQTSNSE